MPRLMILPVSRLPLGKRWLTVGAQGQDVRHLQTLLTELGLYSGALSGEYDLLTREAVKAFQKAYRLAADGVCGPDTCKLLTEERIHNRILRRSGEGETIQTLAEQYGVSRQAFKDPETRSRLYRIEPGQQVMVEKRELIFGVESHEPVVPSVKGPGGKGDVIYMRPEALTRLAPDFVFPSGRSVVVDLTGGPLVRSERKALRRIRRRMNAELIWWQNLEHCRLPSPAEADALILSLPVDVSTADSLVVWPRRVKRILNYYPCTRLLIHFDLAGKERDEKGTEDFLTAVKRRMARLNRIGEPKRVGKYGWLYYRYRYQDETRTVYVPDALTIRGILDQIDRFNLRGAVFTGLEEVEEVWQKEGNRYFLATPRIMVMKDGKLA